MNPRPKWTFLDWATLAVMLLLAYGLIGAHTTVIDIPWFGPTSGD